MDIRFAEERDKNSVKELWSYCFKDSEKYVNYYFANRYEKKNNLILETDEKVAASLLINPYHLKVGEQEHEVSYIVGVSVQPEYRGEGFSSKLLKETLRLLYDRGEKLVLLMPIDTAIYRRYGFINTFFGHTFTLSLKNKMEKSSRTKICKVSYQNEKQLEAMKNLYLFAMKEIYAYMVRENSDFGIRLKELEAEGAAAYLVEEDGEYTAYFTFYPSYEEGKAMVQELIFFNKTALEKVLNFLYQHQTQANEVIIQTPNVKKFQLAMEYTNRMKEIHMPFMMSRVLQAEEILQIWTQEHLKDEKEIFISLKDTMIEENNGVFCICDGKISKNNLVTESDKNQKKADIVMNIEALTLLYMKQASLADLIACGMMKVQNRSFLEKLNRLCETKENYSNDYV